MLADFESLQRDAVAAREDRLMATFSAQLTKVGHHASRNCARFRDRVVPSHGSGAAPWLGLDLASATGGGGGGGRARRLRAAVVDARASPGVLMVAL